MIDRIQMEEQIVRFSKISIEVAYLLQNGLIDYDMVANVFAPLIYSKIDHCFTKLNDSIVSSNIGPLAFETIKEYYPLSKCLDLLNVTHSRKYNDEQHKLFIQYILTKRLMEETNKKTSVANFGFLKSQYLLAFEDYKAKEIDPLLRYVNTKRRG